MFERFTDRARETVVLAQTEAHRLHHGHIGTEHLLLGMLAEGTGVGARALDGLGVGLKATRSEVVRLVGQGPLSPESEDAEALRSIGIDLEEVRRRIEEAFGPGALDRGRWVCSGGAKRVGARFVRHPFTPRAKKVLELSLREAQRLGHNYIGTEHILLGIVREGEGVAAKVLHGRGLPPERIRRAIAEQLAKSGDSPGRTA